MTAIACLVVAGSITFWPRPAGPGARGSRPEQLSAGTSTGSGVTLPPPPPLTTTTEPPVVVAGVRGCRGIGEPGPEPRLTWLVVDELRDDRGCLLRFGSRWSARQPSWDPSGRRLLVDFAMGTYIVSEEGVEELTPAGWWSWLDGDGTLVHSVDGRLEVRDPDGSTSVLAEGAFRASAVSLDRGVVMAVGSVGDRSGIFSIRRDGGPPELLHQADPEAIGWLKVAAGGVLFTEETEQRTTLYLLLPGGRPVRVADGANRSGVRGVASAYDPSAVAWHFGGGCGGPPVAHARLGGRTLDLSATPVASAPPAAWMPDSTLLFLDRGESCDYSPGVLWGFRDGVAIKISAMVMDIAIRPGAASLSPSPA